MHTFYVAFFVFGLGLSAYFDVALTFGAYVVDKLAYSAFAWWGWWGVFVSWHICRFMLGLFCY